MQLRFALLLFLFLTLSTASPAAEPQQEETLKPVVVTATRTEIFQEEATTSVTVITAEEIRQQQAETVLEVLRNVPGLDVVQSGSRGNTTSVFIRGSDADQVLVLIDGVEVNSTTLGQFEFAHLTTENVERIEVLRGAGGTLYGSQAIGGVIQIITKAGKGSPELSLSTEGGNKYTHRQVFGLHGSIGKLGYSFATSRFETDGFRKFNDDYQNLATSTRLDFKPTNDSLLRGIFHFRKTDVGLVNSNNFFFAGATDPNARENVTDYLFKFDWEQKLSPTWDFRLSGSQFKQHDKLSDDVDSCMSFGSPCDSRTRNRFRPRIYAAEFQTNYRWQEWSTTTFGIEYKKRQATTNSIRKDQRNIAPYLQEQLRFFENRLHLVAGIRLDDHQVFGTEWSPSFSAAYTFAATGTKLKFSYTEGFKAPSLNELFFPGFGNPSLGPETSWEVNAGVEQRLFKRLLIGITYFHREVEDLIEAVFNPDTGNFEAQNLNRARLDGIEIFGDINLGHGLSLRTNYTFLESDTATGQLLRRPRHRGNVLLNYQQERFHINLNANIVGKRDDVGVVSGANIEEPGHVKFDLASSYTLPWKTPGVKSVSLFGKVENLFDKRYEEADGFRARPLNFLIGIRGVFARE